MSQLVTVDGGTYITALGAEVRRATAGRRHANTERINRSISAGL
jgi:hypothetical protein